MANQPSEQRRDNLSQSMSTTVWQMNVLFAVRGVLWGSTALGDSYGEA